MIFKSNVQSNQMFLNPNINVELRPIQLLQISHWIMIRILINHIYNNTHSQKFQQHGFKTLRKNKSLPLTCRRPVQAPGLLLKTATYTSWDPSDPDRSCWAGSTRRPACAHPPCEHAPAPTRTHAHVYDFNPNTSPKQIRIFQGKAGKTNTNINVHI